MCQVKGTINLLKVDFLLSLSSSTILSHLLNDFKKTAGFSTYCRIILNLKLKMKS